MTVMLAKTKENEDWATEKGMKMDIKYVLSRYVENKDNKTYVTYVFKGSDGNDFQFENECPSYILEDDSPDLFMKDVAAPEFAGIIFSGKMCMGAERWNILAQRMPILKQLVLGKEGMQSTMNVLDDGFHYTNIPESFEVQLKEFVKLCKCVLDIDQVPRDEEKIDHLLHTATIFGGCEYLEEVISTMRQAMRQANMENPIYPEEDLLQRFSWRFERMPASDSLVKHGWMITRHKHFHRDEDVYGYMRKRKAPE